MAQLRPSFDESWYRVRDLRPRLRTLVDSYRQHYRGRPWWVLRDRASNKYFRLDDAAYTFVGLLDSRRSVHEAWLIAGEKLGDRAPTQGEAIRLLGQLYSANLIEADVPADAQTLLERFRQRRIREVRGYLLGLLFARVPIWDPDAFLDRWTPAVSWLFGPVGMAIWLGLIAYALMQLAGEWRGLWDQGQNVLAPDNLFLLYVAVVFVKFFHELGHGFSCKRAARHEAAAGEVHTLGIMLMVLTPVPYVDASSAWTLRSKWRRAFVGAAGMYVELAIAAIAALVWVNADPGETLHALAYNVIFIAGVTTVLFNANPLIRFDGYYILSDLLEIPNLAQRSNQYVYYLVKKHLYGVRRAIDPSHGLGERPWLLVYAVASFLYRIFLSISIFLFVVDKLFFVGFLLAMLGVVAWVFVPLGKWVHYLLTSPELLRTRTRAVGLTAGFWALLLGLVGALPLPDHGRATGVVQRDQRAEVFAPIDGVVRPAVTDGQRVDAGELLFVIDSPQLENDLRSAQAELARLRALYRRERGDNPAAASALLDRANAMEQRVDDLARRLASARVAAPFAGHWSGEAGPETLGRFVRQGEAIGSLIGLEPPAVKLAATQRLGPRLRSELPPDATVQLRVMGRPVPTLRGRVIEVMAAGEGRLPSPALGFAAGGPIATDPQDTRGEQAAEPFFSVRVELIDPATAQPATQNSTDASPRLLEGQRVVARFDLPPRPLGLQVWRWTRQVFQERFGL